MSDLISRQAAIDAINTWFELYALSRTMTNTMSIQDMIRALPSAQPEIIHCKDCRNLLLTGGNESTGEGIYTCNVWKRRTFKGDAFCSYAERRSDE